MSTYWRYELLAAVVCLAGYTLLFCADIRIGLGATLLTTSVAIWKDNEKRKETP
jgi:hypothetical protein